MLCQKTSGRLNIKYLVWGFDCFDRNNSTVINITFVFQKQEVDHTANETILTACSLQSRLGRKG